MPATDHEPDPALAALQAALPDGLNARSLTTADAAAFTDVLAAGEEHDVGEVAIELADIEADWARPSVDLARESVGVFDGSMLVGATNVYASRRAAGDVLPSYRGRGIGTALARWTQTSAARDGGRVVGSTVPAASPGEAVLRDLGYQRGWTSWVLQLPADASIPDRPLPPGFLIRDAATDELLTVHRLKEDAFNEWPDRQPYPFGDWLAGTVDRAGFEPWHLRVVADQTGRIAGVYFLLVAGRTTFVDQIAVSRADRGQGLAQALLADAFAAGRGHGATVSELSTDSRTGALGLYQRLGMVVTQTWQHWQIELAPVSGAGTARPTDASGAGPRTT